jgi:hypothetical protein
VLAITAAAAVDTAHAVAPNVAAPRLVPVVPVDADAVSRTGAGVAVAVDVDEEDGVDEEDEQADEEEEVEERVDEEKVEEELLVVSEREDDGEEVHEGAANGLAVVTEVCAAPVCSEGALCEKLTTVEGSEVAVGGTEAASPAVGECAEALADEIASAAEAEHAEQGDGEEVFDSDDEITAEEWHAHEEEEASTTASTLGVCVEEEEDEDVEEETASGVSTGGCGVAGRVALIVQRFDVRIIY